MKVKLAKTAGFCMGVRRAMNIVLDSANKKTGKLYTYGPLVHNPQVIDMLKQKGVDIIKDETVSNATIIIRAHGVTPKERRSLKDSGNLVCDATCPHVAKAQSIIKRETRDGCKAIIVGDRGHAEVTGLLGYADGNGFVVESTDDVAGLPEIASACVIAQTTQDKKVFDDIVRAIKARIPDLRVFDTICASTSMRQKEVVELAKEVDAMVIVGGRSSANTKRLHEISLSTGIPSFHIENEDELEHLGLESFNDIGVMAGASTPNWVITKVMERLEALLKKRQGRLFRIMQGFGDVMVESSIYLSAGAVSLCYASQLFQCVRPSAIFLTITFLYVFSVHVFNRYTEQIKDEFFDTARTRFFRNYGKALIVGATIASFVSLYLSYLLGVRDFVLLLFSYLMGVIYSIRIVPERFHHMTRYRRIKDLPGSKDIFVSLAWTWVIVLIPLLNKETFFSYKSAAILFFVAGTVFIRSVVFDVVSIEGDRIVGRETIPILIGHKRTEVLLLLLTVILGLFMFTSAAFGLIPSLGYYLVLSPALMVTCLYFFQRKRIQAGKFFEAVIDSNFILAGLVAFLTQIGK